jgi:erythrocyte band 7 integral membrane protein
LFVLLLDLIRALKDAADVIMQSPTALQLRYLQTLTTIASEKNSTIVFPIPVMNMMAVLTATSYLETQL